MLYTQYIFRNAKTIIVGIYICMRYAPVEMNKRNNAYSSLKGKNLYRN